MTNAAFHEDIRTRFQGSVPPVWLLDFNEEPETALHALLRDVAPLGHLSGAEPDELLLDWLRGFGPESPYARTLDRALTHWIDRHWGAPLLPGTGKNAALTSQAWLRAMEVIAASPLVHPHRGVPAREYPLFGASALLRERMLADRHFLNNMTQARSHDPQGSAWVALANHQTDRTLLEEWWRLVSLPPDEPWYRGEHGLMGLRRLPPANPALGGGFNKELAAGLGCLGEALWRRTEEGWLPEDLARDEFASLAHLAMADSPFPDRWRGYWRHLARQQSGNEGFVEWLPIPPSELLQRSGPGKRQWFEYDPTWVERAKTLARALNSPTRERIAQAEKLLAEQRRYADLTGNASFLVRSASNFSGAIRAADPAQSLAWARMAKTADPWDAYAWTNEAMALAVMGDYPRALARYGEAILRFPNDAVARAGRAEVLKLQERLDEALVAYDETMERFPDDAVARNGRAEVLKLQKRLDEALAAYEETMERFPDDAVARNGRAEVLKFQKRLDEALVAYEETMERFPENAVARAGRAEVLKFQGRLDEALAAYEETIERFPDNVFARTGREKLLELREQRPKIVPAGRDSDPETVVSPGSYPHTGRRFPESGHSASGYISVAATVAPYRVAPEGPALTREEITLLISDAYLLRGWARKGGEDDPWLNTGVHRENARLLLEKLSAHGRHDPLAAGESGLLSLATGDPEDRRRALALLRAAAGRFPGSPRVRYALARAEREEAIATADPSAITSGQWRKLVRLDRHLLPLQWLAPALLWARLPGAQGKLPGYLQQLEDWLSPRFSMAEDTDDARLPVYLWWAKSVYITLFGGDARTEPVHLRIQERYGRLLTLEEELVYSQAYR